MNCKNCKGTMVRENGKYVCNTCGYEEITKEKNCFRCGKRYIEYSWHNPSGCGSCGASFVD